ncbi:MAG: flagellar biosynthetic protein FliR [Alphaproteobacteria bacterium]|nr:MAG: flagellar biosynthetic protein FliR [Alphaproteobacteria bacterium]
MQGALETFLASGVLAFLLTFTRIGTAMMIMPGLGDSFVSPRVRLHMALGISFVLFPVVLPYMPSPIPPTFALATLIIMELVIGVLFGTVARIFMIALDTAGMIISMQSGLANAQVFNPSLATQGSIMGAFLSMTGVLLLFTLNLHHLLIIGLVESYELFPLGSIPDTGSMAEFVSQAIAASFLVGVKLASPFIVLTLIIYVGMGVLSRLMPQIQVFMVALPLQILLSITLFFLACTAILSFWVGEYEAGMMFFLSGGG